MATLGLKEMGKFLWEGSHSKVRLENAKKSLVLKKVGWTLFLLIDLLKSRRFKKQEWVCSHPQQKVEEFKSWTSIFIQKTLKVQNCTLEYLGKAREKVIFAPLIWIFSTFWWWWEQFHCGFLNLLDFTSLNFFLLVWWRI